MCSNLLSSVYIYSKIPSLSIVICIKLCVHLNPLSIYIPLIKCHPHSPLHQVSK